MHYKYMKRMHWEAFKLSGEVRIGTLFSYRNEEAFGIQIGDVAEGISRRHFEKGVVGTLTEDHVNQLKGVMDIQPGQIHLTNNGDIVSNDSSDDHFIYSLSNIKSKQLLVDFEGEVCVQIEDLASFACIMSEAMKPFSDVYCVCDCIYRERDSSTKDAFAHGFQIKAPRYEHQAETRIVFRPKSYPVEHLFLKIPKLIDYACEVKM